MTIAERIVLLVFGVTTWSTGMFTAAADTVTPVEVASPVMAGVGAFLFVAGLLPGRTARFS